MAKKIVIELSDGEFEALKKFKSVGYYDGYYFNYSKPKGYNFCTETVRGFSSAFKKIAQQARRKSK